MKIFNEKELEFILKNEVCCIATLEKDFPHVVPVCYIFKNNSFYIVTDLETRKYKNIKKNSNISLTIFTYKPSKGILIKGKAEILERGKEFKEISKEFFKKFYWARKDPWEEGEAAIIKVKPLKKASWNLN